MNSGLRRSRPTWRVSEGRAIRPELWLIAGIAVSMLLVEVWQSSRVAQLCLNLDQNRSALVQAQARLEFVRARLDRNTTRSELAPLAAQLGLAPAEARQVVNLPAEYLSDGGADGRGGESAPLLALAERAARTIVPDATARGRAH